MFMTLVVMNFISECARLAWPTHPNMKIYKCWLLIVRCHSLSMMIYALGNTYDLYSSTLGNTLRNTYNLYSSTNWTYLHGP